MRTLASNISCRRLLNETKSRPLAQEASPSTCPRRQGDLIIQGKAPPASTNSASLTDLPPTLGISKKAFARGVVQGSGEEREQVEEASAAADLSIRITGEASCAKEPGQLETPDS
jgi:hypothetical protein